MKREKLLAFVITVCILISALPMNMMAAAPLKIGEVLGYTLNTNIKVEIDGYEIQSYSVNDKMAVSMEDLSSYGFDVTYDNEMRELRAYRNVGKAIGPINDSKNYSDEAGSVPLPYVYTDIKTYIDNKEVERFAINGNICIYVDDLNFYGKLSWDGNAGVLKLALSDMSDKTPTKYEFQNIRLNTLSSSSQNFDITGISVKFNGTHYYINPDDFTEMILTKDGERVDSAIIQYEPAQLKFDKNTTTVVFSFNEKITEVGYYGISGKYKDMPFESEKLIIDTYPIGNTPANPDDLNKVVLSAKSVDNSKMTTLSNEIGFYFDGRQESFNISDLTDLKLTVNRQEIEFSLNKDDVQRELKYSEETNTYTTRYFIDLYDYTFTYGNYVLSGKYKGKSFTSNEIAVKTASGKIPASIVFYADSDGVLTRDAVIRQLNENGLTYPSEFVANFDPNVKIIEKWAFSNCIGLIALNYSANIQEMGTLVFDGCDKLQIINVHKENQYFTVSDNVLFNKDKTALILCPATRSGAYVIPDSVNNLCPDAFYNCYYLTEIKIPESVTAISGHSFNNCEGLKELIIPSQVKGIGYGAFAGCTNLKTLTFKGIYPPTIYENAFPAIPTIYVPRVSLSRYEDALIYAIPDAVIKAFD